MVRDVPVAPIRPVSTSPEPRGRKGPAEPRGRKGPAYKEYPQVPNGPAYKELDNKIGKDIPSGTSVVEGVVGSPGEECSHHGALDLARFDADIVAMFDDRGEGWELLILCFPTTILAQLRERQRRRELDALALVNSSCATNTYWRIVGANDGRHANGPSRGRWTAEDWGLRAARVPESPPAFSHGARPAHPLNRDRGASRDAALPHHRAYGSVPRRFGGLSVHQLFHGKQTQTFEARVGEGEVHCVREAHSPRSLWAEDGLAGRWPGYSEAPEFMISPATRLPLAQATNECAAESSYRGIATHATG